MKFFTLAATFLAVVSASASALPKRHYKCLKQYQAEDILAKFIVILEHRDIPAANATAQALLSERFTETSDSILSLEGEPLGTSIFEDKDAYINSVLNAPSVEGINTIEVLVAGCRKIIWYWRFTGIGSAQYPIQGFNLFSISKELQIDALNLEFNTFAWGLNTGYQIIFPPGFPAPPGGS